MIGSLVAVIALLVAPTPAPAAPAAGFSWTPTTTAPYAVCGLPTRDRAACLSIIVPATAQPLGSSQAQPNLSTPAVGFAGSGVGGGYSPADLRSAYALPSGSAGTGQTVAIVDAYDDPNAESDLAVYRSHYGLPACTSANGCFRKVNQTGGTKYPPAESGWAVEISLDLDMASAACPNCHLLLVEAENSFVEELLVAENEAYKLGASQISNSWGAEEFAEETSLDSFFTHFGVSVTAAAGDEGFKVGYPAASPDVISVGGTKLVKASNSRGWSETAWSGSGGGCSAYEPKPSWQTDSGCARRTDNDVAAVASPETPVSVADSYKLPPKFSVPEPGWTLVGGTSVSSPLVAGIMALANHYTKSYPGASGLYKQATQSGTGVLDDIVSGSTGSCGTYLCNAQVGYDGPTGLGSLLGAPSASPEWLRNGAKLRESVKNAAVTWGTITLTTTTGGSGQITCRTASAGSVWDPVTSGGGKGETAVFATYACEQSGVCPPGASVQVVGTELPWTSALGASAAALTKTEQVNLRVSCVSEGSEVEVNDFIGSLTATLLRGTTSEHPSSLVFGSESGSLEASGSGGAVRDQAEGKLKLLGYEEQELLVAG